MVIEVKNNIELPKTNRWSEVWDALDKSPVGSGIQESWDALGIKSTKDANSLRSSACIRYGRGIFSFSHSGDMITIVRVKEETKHHHLAR